MLLCNLIKVTMGAVEMAQQLGIPVVLAEDRVWLLEPTSKGSESLKRQP